MDVGVAEHEILESDRIHFIKLCLEQSTLANATRLRVKGQLDRLPQHAHRLLGSDEVPWPERLVTLYLKLLWKAARNGIAEEYFCSRGDIFRGREVEFWIGVPKFVLHPHHA